MKIIIHLIASIIATLMIALFFFSTLIVEIFADPTMIAQVKSLIVTPGLWILIPAIAATGISGFLLAQTRQGQLVENKQRRMPIIAANGIVILIPAAIFLDKWASAGNFDGMFYSLQTIELLAGCVNLILMSLNMRDGLRLSGKLKSTA